MLLTRSPAWNERAGLRRVKTVVRGMKAWSSWFCAAEEPASQSDVGSALHQRFGHSLEIRRGVLPIRVQGSDDLSALAERINYARLEGRALPEIDRMT